MISCLIIAVIGYKFFIIEIKTTNKDIPKNSNKNISSVYDEFLGIQIQHCRQCTKHEQAWCP